MQHAPKPGKEPQWAASTAIAGHFAEELDLLKRHVHVLATVLDQGSIGIIRLAELTGLPQHKVRYSLRVLEQEGLIRPTPTGAQATDLVPVFLTELRDLVESMQESVEGLAKFVKGP